MSHKADTNRWQRGLAVLTATLRFRRRTDATQVHEPEHGGGNYERTHNTCHTPNVTCKTPDVVGPRRPRVAGARSARTAVSPQQHRNYRADRAEMRAKAAGDPKA